LGATKPSIRLHFPLLDRADDQLLGGITDDGHQNHRRHQIDSSELKALIEAVVEGLDLPAAGFARVEAAETGRPGYRPADLLKLYMYGYLNRIRSSRRLEAATHRSIEVIWRLRHLKPDFKTIADFRRDNRNAFRSVFRQFVPLCKQLDLFGRELLAVDGTRIKAVNKAHRVLSADVVVQGLRQKQELGTVMTGDMSHMAILAQHVPRNPLRENFHTVGKNYASFEAFAALLISGRR
jgi:transposase